MPNRPQLNDAREGHGKSRGMPELFRGITEGAPKVEAESRVRFALPPWRRGKRIATLGAAKIVERELRV